MPLYEYYCNKCDNQFDRLVTETDEVIKCINCDTTDVKKLFSVFGLNKYNSSYSNNIGEPLNGDCCCGTGCGCD